MEILKFGSMVDGDSFAGVTCIKSLQCNKTRNHNDYIAGVMTDKDGEFAFKVWDSTLVEYLKAAITAGFSPTLAFVQGTVGTYNNKLDYTMTNVTLNAPQIAESGYTAADFLPSLACEDLWTEFCNFINGNLSAPWITLLTTVMHTSISYFEEGITSNGTTLNDLLKTAYAATKHHDSIRGGLLNHTLKMLKFASVLVSRPDTLWSKNKDLLYAGIILHDIGKVQELGSGSYAKNSFVSHRVMGVEYLAFNKGIICSLVGADNYYRLLSIITGHHDQYGTPADTVWAYVVHLIDNLDAFTTGVDEMAKKGEFALASNGEAFYPFDNRRLFV